MTDSRICLGTVQFGMDYGIHNKTGKPAREKVFRMLDRAVESGITCFDTAPVYGEAEELLGDYILSRKLENKLRVISKLRSGLNNDDITDIEKTIENEIAASMKRLNIEVLDGCLLHNALDFYNQRIMDGMLRCKELGLFRDFGVSVYETEHALDAVNSGSVDYIQVPYNVLDRRLDKAGFFRKAKENGATVFARSVFLQGLLLMEEKEIPPYLDIAKTHIKQFDSIVKKYDLSRFTVAFNFVYNNPGVDYVVIGVDNIEQLNQYIEAANRKSDVEECLNELKNEFFDVEKRIISPNLWH